MGSKVKGTGKALAYQVAGIEAAQKLQTELLDKQFGLTSESLDKQIGLTGEGLGKQIGLQSEMLDKQLGNQQKNYEFIQGLLNPYTKAGQSALTSSMNLLGLGGAGTQKQAIDDLTSQDYFKGLVSQGEDALLQNASATGGLRGGNTQAALAQFRPQMVSQLVQQQLSNLGGISGMGLNASNTLTGATIDNANAMNNIYGDAYGNMSNAYGNAYGNMTNAYAGGYGNMSNAYGNVYDKLSNLSIERGNAFANRELAKGSKGGGLGSLLGAGLNVAGVAAGLGFSPFSKGGILGGWSGV